MQEVGFPTRNEVEGGRRPVCTSAARKIGVLLARARDGVPQEGLVSLLCAERGESIWVGVAGGKGPQRRVPEDGGILAGCRLGGAFPPPFLLVTLVLCLWGVLLNEAKRELCPIWHAETD